MNELEKHIDENVGYLTLNRPEKHNALDGPLLNQIVDICNEFDQNNDVHAIIFQSRGTYFSSGIDLNYLMDWINEMKESAPSHSPHRTYHFKQQIQYIQNKADIFAHISKPIIVGVQGPCWGLAFGMLCGADIVCATHQASFCIKEVDLGIIADVGTLQRLPHSLSLPLLRYMAYTGEPVSSHTLFQVGFLNNVLDNVEDMRQWCTQTARTIALKNPSTIRGIKKVLNSIHAPSINAAFSDAAYRNSATFARHDFYNHIEKIVEKLKQSPKR